MAAVLTYNSLVVAVQNYLERSNPTFISDIPLFIMLGERRVARDLKILGLKVFITGTLTTDPLTAQILAKPTRWLSTSTFNIGTGDSFNTRKQILERSYEYVRIYWPDPTVTGEPKYFSDYDYNHWLLGPTPDEEYPYEIAYYQTPELIDETTSTNYLTENAPDILLYATLLETASYLKDDERIAVWKGYYDGARGALSNEDQRRIYDGFSVREG